MIGKPMDRIKIAAVTEDGQTLSSHFGMADQYRFFSVEDDRIVSETRLDKPHHDVHPHHDGREHTHSHSDMLAPIRNCQVVLCGGMGEGAYLQLSAAGLQVVLTGGPIEQAVQKYLRGELASDTRRLHQH
jgi:predicted Fe-Mo cluster-binding NifX family protein